MAYRISLTLPSGWNIEEEVYQDDMGFDISHFEAHLKGDAEDSSKGMIDIYVGDMPEDETAEDQALANYAEVVGFDEDDPEDFNPISKIKFNGKNAWSFEALCEDDSPMRFISQEIRKGTLAIVVFAAPDDERLDAFQLMIEKGLRISTN